MELKVINWDEENRFNYTPLHVGNSGARTATVTSVAWLTPHLVVAAHHSAGKIGIFDTRSADGTELLGSFNIEHRIDDLALYKVNRNRFVIVVSGTWAKKASTFILELTEEKMSLKKHIAIPHDDKTFSHGVFLLEKKVGICLHDGEFPRVEIGNSIIALPWGEKPTSAYYQKNIGELFICCNHYSPTQHKTVERPKSSFWRFTPESCQLKKIGTLENCHTDKIQLYDKRLYYNNQYTNSLDSFKISEDKKGNPQIKENSHKSISLPEIDFPHGFEINEEGMCAIACYKNSSIVLFSVQSC